MVSIGDISVERDADSRRDHKSPNSRKDAHSTDKENIFANAGGSRERGDELQICRSQCGCNMLSKEQAEWWTYFSHKVC